MNEEINYRGLDRLDAMEIAITQKITFKEFSKIKRKIDNAVLVIDIKKNQSGGKKAMYDIKARVEAPALVLHAEHSGWELEITLHKTFDNLKTEIEHKFTKKETKKIKERRVRQY